MSSDLLKKRESYKIQIRKQSLNKLLTLKRIKPKLIQSNQQALTILLDGLDILKKSQNEQELVQALRSMIQAFKIYDFNIYPKVIRQSIQNIKWLITDPMKRDVIKEEGTQLLTILCFYCPDIISFNDIPFKVFQGYNLKMIRITLIGLCQLVSNFQIMDTSILKQNIFDSQILKRLNIILANFGGSNQCFEFIKIPFLSFSISLCFIAYNWNINRNDNDFQRLLEFSTMKLEQDIIQKSQRDYTLAVFFEKFYKRFDTQTGHHEVHELAYPFENLILITKMIQEFNVDVLQAFSRCLDFQLQNNTVQRPLVKCLISIFKETNTILDEQLRKKIFNYIFQMKYVGKQNEDCIKEIILLALNNSANDQSMNENIFEAMGDRDHKKYPQTCHLLELMEYLQERQDPYTQKLLMELIENYMTYNGSSHYIKQCQYQLANFKQGAKMLERIGFQSEIQEYDRYSQEIYDI